MNNLEEDLNARRMQDHIEAEVTARVNFKMNEFISAVEAEISRSNYFLMESIMEGVGRPDKHMHYKEAFNKMLSLIRKERDMAVPYENMHAIHIQKIKDKAVSDMQQTLSNSQIGPDRIRIITRSIVDIIENTIHKALTINKPKQ